MRIEKVIRSEGILCKNQIKMHRNQSCNFCNYLCLRPLLTNLEKRCENNRYGPPCLFRKCCESVFEKTMSYHVICA